MACTIFKNMSAKECANKYGRLTKFGFVESNSLDTIENLKLEANFDALINGDRGSRLYLTPGDASVITPTKTDANISRTNGIVRKIEDAFYDYLLNFDNYSISFAEQVKNSWDETKVYMIGITSKGYILAQSIDNVNAIGAPVKVFVDGFDAFVEDPQNFGIQIWAQEDGSLFNIAIKGTDYNVDDKEGIVDLEARMASGSTTLTGGTAAIVIDMFTQDSGSENVIAATTGDFIFKNAAGVVEAYSGAKVGNTYTLTASSAFTAGVGTLEITQSTAATDGIELQTVDITIS